jgi:transaldolase/glucose-6-phosphate isomerase
MTNPLLQLTQAGQSVWLDFVQRNILDDGTFRSLIEDDGVAGVTSNPSIFEKAIAGSRDYDAALGALVEDADSEVADLYERLAAADIRAAADQLRPLYDRRGGRDGFVSLEVSPYLAMDAEATVAEARRLWRAVGRPNLMIKVPGTAAGVPAVRQLISEGINVNVTLLFSLGAYRAVSEAHLAGLEARLAAGGDIARVAGVASFFVSRIDAKVDEAIDRRLAAGVDTLDDTATLAHLRGKVAIANAKVAYQHYLSLIASPRWKALAAAGAQPQRLLWASTATKNPEYSDVLYVESLIGPDTVNTIPPKTLDAFRHHGRVRPTLVEHVDAAALALADAERLGLDLDGVTEALVEDGVRQFADAADSLLAAVAEKRLKALGERLNAQSLRPSPTLEAAFADGLERARAEGWSRRLWAKDAGLWTGGDEARWLNWLEAGRGERVDLTTLEAFQAAVKARDFSHILLLGMGGSSLGPEVFAETFGVQPGFPRLLVLDSTDPAQVARFASQIDPARTLYIVASKSGSTLEPDILHRYFFDLAARALGAQTAAAQFVAITDPGSKLEATAKADGFWRVFSGDPNIGGRYSVLSNFGLVPAAAAGVGVAAFLDAARVMARACGASAPATANPGVDLGVLLGCAAKAGRDKLTVLASHGVADFGAWLEQLVAESTGKRGLGVIPVDAEPPGEAAAYGADRIFAYLRLNDRDQPELDTLARDLEEAGHPVVRIQLADRGKLGQEFFRWEIATAVAGAVIGIHPFDQPDVEASKVETRALTEQYAKTGALAPQTAVFADGDIRLFADAANAQALAATVGAEGGLEAWIGAHLARAGVGDYVALLAYIDRDHPHIQALARMRRRIRDARRLATAVGFGPRFLHSTGQAYKGGPNSGVFLQITADAARDLAVPGGELSFGLILAAQAQGDLQVLNARHRRALRVHLGADVTAGLARLERAVDHALG